jgi:transcriptional regulator with XRE-family HTH domain
LASTLESRLRGLRGETHLSQAEAAKIANVSLRGYGDIERGVSSPSLEFLKLLADYFNVSLDYLTGRSERRD